MSEDEVIKAVTAKLTGEFYVGQRVQVVNVFGSVATVQKIGPVLIDILWGDGVVWRCARSELVPAAASI